MRWMCETESECPIHGIGKRSSRSPYFESWRDSLHAGRMIKKGIQMDALLSGVQVKRSDAERVHSGGGRRIVARRLIAHIARHADVIARERISPDVSGLASIRSVLAVDIDSG